MINLSKVTSITIPEGNPINLQIDDEIIWRKHSLTYNNLLYELSEDGSHYSCVGVKSGFEATTVKVDGTISRTPVTEICGEAFSPLSGLTKITFERTPESIAADAFVGCDSLATVVIPNASDILDGSPWGSGYLRPTFYIEGVQYRRHNTTSNNRYIVDTPSSTLFKGGDIELIDNIGGTPVYELDSGCFQNKTTLTSIVIPASVKAIEANVFKGCTGLKTATFKGTIVGTIPETVFDGCTNLTDVYVPWAEGVKANAPWGATNATVHYNYTG